MRAGRQSTRIRHGAAAGALLAALVVASLAAPGGGPARAATGGLGSGSWQPAFPGRVYEGGATWRAGAAGRSVAPWLGFYDAAGKQLAAVWGQATINPVGAAPSPTVTGIAPPGTAFVRLGFVVAGAVVGGIQPVTGAWLTSRAGPAPAVAGPLRTSGTSILDAAGHPVVLRGLNRSGTEESRPTFPTDDEIAHAKAWGANVMRVPLTESLWLNTCVAGGPTPDPGYASALDSEVTSITSRGMVAILDLHLVVVSPCTGAGLNNMPDAANSIPFWSQVASRYGSNPLVAFDLYNEPHDVPDTVWRNGGTITEGGVTYQAAGMQQLYDTVRATGAGNLVLVSGNAWGNAPSTVPVTGPGIVDAAHAYTCPSALPPKCPWHDWYNPSTVVSRWLRSSPGVPVMLTEFGWPDRMDGRYNTNAIALAQQNGWGWTVFAWDGKTAGQFDLLADNGTDYEPVPAGQPVLAGLGANLG